MANSAFVIDRNRSTRPWQGPAKLQEESADLCLIRVNDEGQLGRTGDLDQALDCIRSSRIENPTGVVVLTFIHGWRHDARWADSAEGRDSQLTEFMEILIRLALRESERNYPYGICRSRRVIGVYIGWPGSHVPSWIPRKLWVLSFGNRYKIAKRLGNGDSISTAISGIIKATKEPLKPVPPHDHVVDCPLVLMGHSMGAMILQNAFRALLSDKNRPLEFTSEREDDPRYVATSRDGKDIRFPDLVLLANSATESRMLKETAKLLQEQEISRQLDYAEFQYRLPIVISVSSERDCVTKWLFPIGRLLRRTDGNDKALHTHKVTKLPGGYLSTPKLPLSESPESGTGPKSDYGQSWHSVRPPEVETNQLTKVAIDLPQLVDKRDPCHIRYEIERKSDLTGDELVWAFRVPRDIIGDHSEVLNGRSNLFFMALMQISGAVVSLTGNWNATFEPDEGACDLPSSS